MTPLTVQDLVDSPAFGVTVIAGASRLAVPVTWLHISTTAEIVQWIEAGDVVLTGGRNLPRAPAEQRQLMARLARRGAAALAIGSIEGPEDITGLIAGAEQSGLPLLSVDRAVSWGALGRAVADANDQAMRAGLRDQIRIFETLQARIDGEIDFATALSIHARITGYRLFLANSAGRPALAGLDPLPPHLAHALASERPAIDEGFAVPVQLGPLHVATLVAEQARPAPSGLNTLRHVATLAAMELADLERRRETLRRVGADAFARIRSGTLAGADAGAALAGLGLDGPWVLVRVRGDEQVADAVSRVLANHDVAHIITVGEPGVDILSDDGAEAPWAEVSRIAGSVASMSRGFVDAADLGIAARQVEWGLQQAAAGADGLLRFDEAVAAVGWLPPDRAGLESLVRKVIGPVIDYDRAHGSSLLETLRIYLRRDRSVSAVGAELYLHRQTINYRLGRVVKLTGRDLRSVAATSELWLAVNAYDALSGTLPLPDGVA